MTDSKTRERVVVAVRRCLPGIPHLRHTPLPRWSLMRAHPRPLSAVCATLPDFRTPRGTRHPVTAICALACCALFWGARSDRAIAAWGRHDGTRLAQALGCTHAPPCAATRHPICRHVDRAECETHVGAWADRVVGSLPTPSETPEPAVVLEGTTRRGSNKQGAPGTPRFSALAHQGGVTLAHHAVDDHTHEIPAVETL
jgi:hypothetical protein